jgi:hypothetical protein
MEAKALGDDIKDGIVEEPIYNDMKKGRYWLITYYEKDEEFNQKVLAAKINAIKEHKTIKKHLQSIVGQIEVGEESEENVMRLSVTFDDSEFKPLPSFKSIFGKDVYANTNKIPQYNSYCSKDYNRLEGTHSIFDGIDKEKVGVFERDIEIEEEKEIDEEEVKREKKKEERLVKVESDISSIGGKITTIHTDIISIKLYKITINTLVEENKKLVEGMEELKEENKKLKEEAVDNTALMETFALSINKLRVKLGMGKMVIKDRESNPEKKEKPTKKTSNKKKESGSLENKPAKKGSGKKKPVTPKPIFKIDKGDQSKSEDSEEG